MRALMGMVQLLVKPIIFAFSAWFISAISLSGVMPFRHSSEGFRSMTVSIISSGAGSVAVSARPALAKTPATSGKPIKILSCS